ncbi:MAG: ferrous iron transport protein A [Bacteriovoracaceae bacterium]|nr:ferrous iron transport protein A [Bacteriovoracaceae bacterium]
MIMSSGRNKTLRTLPCGSVALVEALCGPAEVNRRIRDFGIVRGTKIKMLGKAPLNDPVAVEVENNVISLRNSEADYILIKDLSE